MPWNLDEGFSMAPRGPIGVVRRPSSVRAGGNGFKGILAFRRGGRRSDAHRVHPLIDVAD
jgi:hypothetical protein